MFGERLRRDLLLDALERHQWLIATTARDLGVSRQAVYGALERHGIQRRRPSRAAIREAKARGGRARRREAA